jgi:CRP-like cAMP-binding protein
MKGRSSVRSTVAGDGAGPPLPVTQNEILALIPDSERAVVMEHTEEVEIPLRREMFEEDDTIDRVYFPLTGMVSLVVPLKGGTTVEAMTVGKEGFIGLPLLNQVPTARYKGICQIEGKFLSLSADAFLSVIDDVPDLLRRLRRYAQFASEVAAQSAACNGVHNVEQRCARWLLVTSDAIGETTFNLTQEFLSQMLAVRRSGVTVTMAGLAKRALVSYKYRNVTLLDVPGLEQASCECYATIRGKARELLT